MNKQQIIDEFMDHIDFEKIHRVMQSLDWSWQGTRGVPELYEIRQFLRKLLNEFIDRNLDGIRCGGFCIQKEGDIIRVSFEVNSWEVDLTEE